MSTGSCNNQIEQQVLVYHCLVALSLLVTVAVSILGGHCLRDRLADASYRHRYYLLAAIIKACLAFIIFGIVPSCPTSCICNSDFSNFYFYPVIAFIISVSWFSKAMEAKRDMNNPEVVSAVAVAVADGSSSLEMDQTTDHTTKGKDGYSNVPVADSSIV